MDWIKKLDIEMLKKRYEKMQKRRELENDDTSRYGMGYAYVVDGRVYTVCAMFPIGDYESTLPMLKGSLPHMKMTFSMSSRSRMFQGKR